MSKMNRNKSVEICLMAVATCIVLTGLWTVLATPKKALAAPPAGKGNGGGDEGTSPVCILFEGDGVQSDDYDDDGTPDSYCDDKQLSVEAIMTQDGHVNLYPNTGRGNRTLYVKVDLDGDGPGEAITTEGWRFLVGGWNEAFDMRTMVVNEVCKDVNLMINMKAPPNDENIVNWRLIFDPYNTRWVDGVNSTYVTVTCTAEDETTGDPCEWVVENKDEYGVLSKAALVLEKKIKNKSVFTRYGGNEATVTVPPFTAKVTLN
jgi:hypothetical protein